MLGTYLQSTVPSFKASSKSPWGSLFPRLPSIHCRTSLALWGVYLSKRIARKSLSREVTDAMTEQRRRMRERA